MISNNGQYQLEIKYVFLFFRKDCDEFFGSLLASPWQPGAVSVLCSFGEHLEHKCCLKTSSVSAIPVNNNWIYFCLCIDPHLGFCLKILFKILLKELFVKRHVCPFLFSELLIGKEVNYGMQIFSKWAWLTALVLLHLKSAVCCYFLLSDFLKTALEWHIDERLVLAWWCLLLRKRKRKAKWFLVSWSALLAE